MIKIKLFLKGDCKMLLIAKLRLKETIKIKYAVCCQ